MCDLAVIKWTLGKILCTFFEARTEIKTQQVSNYTNRTVFRRGEKMCIWTKRGRTQSFIATKQTPPNVSFQSVISLTFDKRFEVEPVFSVSCFSLSLTLSLTLSHALSITLSSFLSLHLDKRQVHSHVVFVVKSCCFCC